MSLTPRPIALITGASRGIGAQTAIKFARHGYLVVINYQKNQQAAERVKQQIEAEGDHAITYQADVSEPQQVEQLFAAIDELNGDLRVLVNNVGILKKQSRLVDMDLARFNQVMHTNVNSCFLCSVAAVKRMSSQQGGQGGVIVNVSSMAACTGSPNEYVDYAASKGAMDSLTRGLALEVANEGIRVNAVRPGLIYTDIHASGGEDGRVDRLSSRIPLQRGGKAEEVANAIYFLACDEASFVTGSFVDVSGGL